MEWRSEFNADKGMLLVFMPLQSILMEQFQASVEVTENIQLRIRENKQQQAALREEHAMMLIEEANAQAKANEIEKAVHQAMDARKCGKRGQ